MASVSAATAGHKPTLAPFADIGGRPLKRREWCQSRERKLFATKAALHDGVNFAYQFTSAGINLRTRPTSLRQSGIC
jgi:hypothetical protein